MRSDRLLTVLKAALLAGLAAGVVLGLFHFVLTEPVIDRAIDLEEIASAAPGQGESAGPLVSRGLQKGMLLVGSALYGLLLGMLFAVLFALLGRWLPGRWPDVKAAVLAGLFWWSVGLLPFLKYPANPPGVGDPDTLYYRQGLMFGFIALSTLTVAAAGLTYWLLGRRWQQPGAQGLRLGVAIALYGAMAVLLFRLMPANPDPVTAPADLMWHFRILSMSGQAFFWVVLGGVSALLLRRFARQGLLGEAS